MMSSSAGAATATTFAGHRPPTESQIDIGQLFSDVSRTVNGFKSMFGAFGDNPMVAVAGAPRQNDDADEGMPDGSSSSSRNLFGNNVCFKACGMEDIQLAARRAGDMLVSLRHAIGTTQMCMMILTIVIVICMVALSSAIIWYLCTSNRRKSQTSSADINDYHRQSSPSQRSLSSVSDTRMVNNGGGSMRLISANTLDTTGGLFGVKDGGGGATLFQKSLCSPRE